MFRATTDRGERSVGIVARASQQMPPLTFPHLFSDAGESLGAEALDKKGLERAEEIVAVLDAAQSWNLWRSKTRRRGDRRR
jgi:hypothetical protein